MVKHFLLSQFTIKLRENIAGIKNQLVRQLNQTTSNNSKFLAIEHGKMDRSKGTMQLHFKIGSVGPETYNLDRLEAVRKCPMTSTMME